MKTLTTILCLSLSLLFLTNSSQADQVRDILNNFQQDMMQTASGQMQPTGVRDILYPAPAFSNESAQAVRTVLNQFQADIMQTETMQPYTIQPQFYPGLTQPYYAPAPQVAYPMPYYAAVQMVYPQQYSQSVAEWLFGTPRSRPIPAEVADVSKEPVQVAAVIAPQPAPRERGMPQATPTPVPAPPTPAPGTTQADAAHIAATQAAAEQAAADQQLALLAQTTRQAQHDAFRWMGLTIVFGLLTGGVCLYIFWQTGYKEG